VPAQIAVLLALTEELFDRVALVQMPNAEHAVRKAAANIPAGVCGRFESADKLSDEDRNTIIEIVRESLAPFQPKPEPKAEATLKPEAKAEQKSEPASKAKPKSESEPKLEPKAKAEPDGGPKPDAQMEPVAEPKKKS
jgi:F-type H+-transporting ATPase subunit alpha